MLKRMSVRSKLVNIALAAISLSVFTGIASPSGATMAKAADEVSITAPDTSAVDSTDTSQTPVDVPTYPTPEPTPTVDGYPTPTDPTPPVVGTPAPTDPTPTETPTQGTITKLAQTITYPDNVEVAATDTSIPKPTKSGDGSFVYAVVNRGQTGCTILSSQPSVHATAPGICTVKISLTETNTYLPTSKLVKLNFSTGLQPIKIAFAPAYTSFGDYVDVVVTGNATPVTITVDPSSSENCSITGIRLHGYVNGPCNFTVFAPGTGLYLPTTVSGSIPVEFLTPTVTWNPTNLVATLPTTSMTPSSLASTDGPGEIHYRLAEGTEAPALSTSDCRVDEFTAVMTWSKSGTCVVAAVTWATRNSYPAMKIISFTINPDPTNARLASMLVYGSDGSVITPISTDDGVAGFDPNKSVYWIDGSGKIDMTSVRLVLTSDNPQASVRYGITAVPRGGSQIVNLTAQPFSATIYVSTPQGGVKLYTVFFGKIQDVGFATAGNVAAGQYRVLNTALATERVTSVSIAGDSGFNLSDGNDFSCLYSRGYVIYSGAYCTVTASYSPTGNEAPGYMPRALITVTAVDVNGGVHYSYVQVAASRPAAGVPAGTAYVPNFKSWVPGTLPLATTLGRNQTIYQMNTAYSLNPTSNITINPGSNTGVQLTYAVVNPGTSGCSVDFTHLRVSWTAPGTCVVEASAPAAFPYRAATLRTTFTLSGVKPPTQSQVINYPDTVDLTAADNQLPVATSNADSAFAYTVVDAGTTGCQVGQVIPTIKASAEGSCVIKIDATSTSTHLAASKLVTVNFSSLPQPIQVSLKTRTGRLALAGDVIVTGNISQDVTISVDPSSSQFCRASNLQILGIDNGPCNYTVTVAQSGLWLSTSVTRTDLVNWILPNITWTPTNLVGALPNTSLTPSELAVTDGPGVIHYTVASRLETDALSTSDCTVEPLTGVIHWTTSGSCAITATTWASDISRPQFTVVTFTIKGDPMETRLSSVEMWGSADDGTINTLPLPIATTDVSQSEFSPDGSNFAVDASSSLDTRNVMIRPTSMNKDAHITVNGMQLDSTGRFLVALNEASNRVTITVTTPEGASKNYTFFISRLIDLGMPDAGNDTIATLNLNNTSGAQARVSAVEVLGDTGFAFRTAATNSCIAGAGANLGTTGSCSLNIVYVATDPVADGYTPRASVRLTLSDAAGVIHYSYINVAAHEAIQSFTTWSAE